jgi:hypothetical protein
MLLPGGHIAVEQHRVEVPPDRGRADAHGLTQLGGGRATVGQQIGLHPGTRRPVHARGRDGGRLQGFHNGNVT